MGNHSLRHQMEALKLLHELNGTRTARSNAEVSSDDSGSRRKSLKHKPQTVAERARESQFSRLVEILSQIISIEQDLLRPLSEDLGSFLLRHKDSVDLRNICQRMALSEAGCQSDRDLKELRVCLQLIVDNLLSAVREENSLSSLGAVRRLVGISTTFSDM
ncbi:leukemia-associated protein 7 [Colossoma macropomum]|uniref:leukemia-associated protein 7 n=1 Tax=Colossoma macropomum TaxID=42526 RepID=UPI0018643F7C|nr:leukemia-associated protein 7 [Colossoma macropomum]